MKRSKKRNHVSWPPDSLLCQMKLFLSDDCPSLVGLGAQDQLQEKASWILHSNSMQYNGRPPGFGRTNLLNNGSFGATIPWKSPPKFVLNHNWQVASGEESQEAGAEKRRALTVLEAIYPRISSIPSSPIDTSESYMDHEHDIPIISVTPIEEEEAILISSDIVEPILPDETLTCEIPSTLSPRSGEKLDFKTEPRLEADIVAAASAVFTAIMKSKERGNMIDTNLLIEILSDPKMVEKLVEGHAAVSNSKAPATTSIAMPVKTEVPSVPQAKASPTVVMPSVTQLNLASLPVKAPISVSKQVSSSVDLLPTLLTGRASLKRQATSSSSANRNNTIPEYTLSVKRKAVKDINYYRSLVKQHGGKMNETQDHSHSQELYDGCQLQDQKLVTQTMHANGKLCVFYGSKVGCKSGSNCPFQHALPFQPSYANGGLFQGSRTKRMRRA